MRFFGFDAIHVDFIMAKVSEFIENAGFVWGEKVTFA